MKGFDIKPPIVLTAISGIVCTLLVVFYHLTYVDTTGVITDKMRQCLDELYGEGGSYTMLLDGEGEVVSYDGVTSVIIGEDGSTAFEVIADGYEKGGLHLMIAVEDGKVGGISVVSISETPGLGTKVADGGFLSTFKGLSLGEETSVDNLSGATFSSKGVKSAVAAALSAYNSYKEEYGDGN